MLEYDFSFNEIYDMTPKEMLKTIERRKVGLAFKIWKNGMMCQMMEKYPSFEDSFPELLPEKKGIEMPEFLREKYQKQELNRMKGGI